MIHYVIQVLRLLTKNSSGSAGPLSMYNEKYRAPRATEACKRHIHRVLKGARWLKIELLSCTYGATEGLL